MQTFLPYEDFTESASVLDRMRLGKQRVECLQILRTLRGLSDGWRNHPAVRMWRGHEGTLYYYMSRICAEWVRRGYVDNCMSAAAFMHGPGIVSYSSPSWLGDEAFHASHRSNLLRKMPEHYVQFGWKEAPDLEYVWP